MIKKVSVIVKSMNYLKIFDNIIWGASKRRDLKTNVLK